LPTIEHANIALTRKRRFDLETSQPGFGALAIFAYVGAEVSIGSFLVNYFSQADIAGFPRRVRRLRVVLLGGAMVGRFLGAGLLRKFRAGTPARRVCDLYSSLVSLSMLTHGHFAMWSILAVGFSIPSCFQQFSVWEWPNSDL
jgi:fucose permease